MKRTHTLSVSMSAILASGAVLGGGLIALAKTKPASVHLVVWTAPDSVGIKWWHKEIPKFERLHPNISVTVYQESQGDNYAKYTTAITGHKAPDLMLTYTYTIVPSWAASGFLAPLNPYLNQLHFRQNTFFPFINHLDNLHGKTYGLVQAYDDLLFTWNKTAFQKAGLNPNKPPHTFAQLWTDAKKLTKFKNGKLVQAGFIPWLEISNSVGTLRDYEVLFGGNVLQGNRWTLNAPAMKKAAQLWLQYNKLLGGTKAWQAFLAKTVGTSSVTASPPSSSPQDPFYKGTVAMSMAGDWYPVATYPVYAPHLRYGEAPPPVGPGVAYGRTAMLGNDTFVVPVDAPHPLQATELAVFLDGVGPAIAWDKLESNMPPIAAAVESPKFLQEVPTEWPSVVAAKKHLLVPYPVNPVWSTLDAQTVPNVEEELYFGKISPAKAAETLQSAAVADTKTFNQSHPGW